MFEHMLLPTGGTHQRRNAIWALGGQAVVAAVLILVVPVLYVAQLPKLELATELIAPPLPPPPPPPRAAATRAPSHPEVQAFVPRTFVVPQVAAPTPVPQQAALVADAPPALADNVAGGVPGGIPGGVLGGTLDGELGGVIGAPPAPTAPAAPVEAAAPSAIRVGGEVQAARLTHEVAPQYPSIARQARVAGTVELSAVISPNGKVEDLKVMSGNPLLVDAAVNAVKQWTYQPTYLNGKPVEVLTEVDVRFTLS